MEKTKLTVKYQTSIPPHARHFLGVKPGETVEWHMLKGMVVVSHTKKIKDPVHFLTSQVTLDLNAVELVRGAREDVR